MTYRVCSICGNQVPYEERFATIEERVGSKVVHRVSGHYVCLALGRYRVRRERAIRS